VGRGPEMTTCPDCAWADAGRGVNLLGCRHRFLEPAAGWRDWWTAAFGLCIVVGTIVDLHFKLFQ
jgi:hypothetical protein